MLGQGITLIALPFITRIYGPDSYGVFAYVASLATVIAAFASLRFEAAIPIAPDQPRASALTRLAIITTTLFSVLCIALVALTSQRLDDQSALSLRPWLWFVPLLVWLNGIYAVLTQAAIRLRDYAGVARRTVTQALSTTAIQLAAPHGTPGGLLLGQAVGRAAAITTLWIRTRRLRGDVRHASSTPLTTAAREYWRFPVLLAPSAGLSVLGLQLPLLLVGMRFGAQVTGQFGLAYQVAAAPAALVGVALSQVFLGELSGRVRGGHVDVRRFYLRSSRRLLAVALLAGAALLVIVPPMLPLLLGPNWDDVAQYVRIMAVPMALSLLVSPLSQVFVVSQRLDVNIALDALRVVLVLLAAHVAAVLSLGPSATIALMFTGLAITYVAIWFMGLRVAATMTRVSSARIRSDVQ